MCIDKKPTCNTKTWGMLARLQELAVRLSANLACACVWHQLAPALAHPIVILLQAFDVENTDGLKHKYQKAEVALKQSKQKNYYKVTAMAHLCSMQQYATFVCVQLGALARLDDLLVLDDKYQSFTSTRFKSNRHSYLHSPLAATDACFVR
jgi:hypothetical protein